MEKRMIEKLLGAAQGEIATVSPDMVLVTNGFSHGVTEHFSRVSEPEKVLVMYDHNVPSGSPEDARIFGEILTFSKEYGTRFLQAKGTGLQYLLKEEVKPGRFQAQLCVRRCGSLGNRRQQHGAGQGAGDGKIPCGSAGNTGRTGERQLGDGLRHCGRGPLLLKGEKWYPGQSH